MRRETSVSVRHEDLREVKTAISTAPEVFAYIRPLSPTSRPIPPRPTASGSEPDGNCARRTKDQPRDQQDT
jgi:hypothetical protein